MIVPKSITITSSVNGNQSELGEKKTLMVGPTIALTKGLMENKIKSTLSTSWNKSYTNAIGGTRILNVRVNGTYVFKKKHNFNINLITLYRNPNSSAQKGFTEFTGTLGYSFSF
jgi:hypothetical protein